MPPGFGRLPDTMKTEWRQCPRCKNRFLKPEIMHADAHGNTKYWWICENFDTCNFPLDMPANIYHVLQSPQEKQQKVIPLPNIYALPEKYHYLYPLTFASSSRAPSRCSSVAPSNPANSRNETTIDSSTDGTISEKSSGQNRLKALSLKSGGTINSATPSTSAQSSEKGEQEENNDNLDEEVEAAAKKPTTRCRTVRRKRYHDNSRSWAALIEKVSADEHAASSIINMEESELFQRMKEFFDAQYYQRTPMTFKRPGIRLDHHPSSHPYFLSDNSYSVMYRVEDVDRCLQAITRKDWRAARGRISHMTVGEQESLKTKSSKELLKSVGIDLQQMKKVVGEKVGKVMRGFSTDTASKRQKLEESRKLELQQRQKREQDTIHQSLSARILHKKMKRDEEERSRASTPAVSVHDFSTLNAPEYPLEQFQGLQEPSQNAHFELQNPQNLQNPYQDPPQHVHFHLGDEEPEQQWGFDLDGLYESIHAENYQNLQTDPLSHLEHQGHQAPDPLEHLELLEPLQNSGDEAEEVQNEEDFTTGFNDDFGVQDGEENSNQDGNLSLNLNLNLNPDSNFDFVNDNFEF